MKSSDVRNEKIDHIVCTQNFAWTPIIIGALVAVGLGFLLNLFGKSIGLSLYTNNVDGATVLAIGGFLGLAIGTFAAMFTAGFSAGYFAGPTCGKRNYGAVYGFIAWCLSLLLSGLLAANVANAFYDNANDRTVSPTKTEVGVTTTNVASRLHPATDAGDTRTEKNVRAAGLVSFALFILFFIGALAASFGGFYGFTCWDKWDDNDRRY